ncbi:hypothetical protein [Thalassotalea profundi]|uniref:Uncharacterized protein n=1 Tax=Thalassotalea profundi TaxID=2036687 RepID=A0ABQ3ILP8_9GAMM|nr:hypothetical protein [Thalassotalea profundi]GHE87465.1 hypothetical protein GCM10011501_16180 [Thalassotalea profundi]
MQALKPALPFAKGTIKNEIINGISQLYSTNARNLYIVTRPEGAELVIVAVVGKNLLSAQQEIINFAKINGFKTIRFHTTQIKRLKKGLRGLNYQLVEHKKRFLRGDEYVYRLRLY